MARARMTAPGRPWSAITRGGLVPAMIVSRELDIRVVDTIRCNRYNHQAQTERAW